MNTQISITSVLRGTFLLFAVKLALSAGADDPIVETSLGKVQGSILQSLKGADIYAFRGIRYAKAPIGELRFAEPVAVDAWTDTLDATSDGPICPQIDDKAVMSEDCLILNVYSGNLSGSAPVIVYIHGGSNKRGSGHSVDEAGPQYLLDYDVMLVAINYRLGALGFMSTRTEEARGNFGYLDQIMALKWVKTHIANFGGDPESVTIFGMSAGSMAVTLHMASPLSRGLFHRAIAMSGSATNHYAIDNVYWTQKLAREVKCPMYNPKDVIDCLRKVSWEKIIDVSASWEPYGFINMKWNYEVDGRFLMKHPSDVFYDEDFYKVPLLAGFTKHELDYSVYHQENNTGLLNDMSLNFDLYAPELFMYNATEDEDESTGEKKSDKIRTFYLGENNNITSDNLVNFGQIFSDSIISDGVYRLIKMAREHIDVYYYRMDYVGDRSFYVDENNKPRGVCHGDDLHYILPSDRYGAQLALDHEDMFMVERLTKWWTTFARTGSPMLEAEDLILWVPTTDNDTVTLYNGKDISLGTYPFVERLDLWEEMFPVRTDGASTIKLSILLSIFALTLKSILEY